MVVLRPAGDRARAAGRAPGEPGGGRRLLDAGCGTGYNLLALGGLGRATGVDLSPDAIAFCRERGVRALRGSVLQLPFADACFDAVTSFDVLYHAWVSDDRAAVAEMARVLRPGGVALVRVPALKALWGAHDVEVQSRHRYTRGELVALLEGCGLRRAARDLLQLPALPAALRPAHARPLRSAGEGSDVGFLPAPLEWAFARRAARRGGARAPRAVVPARRERRRPRAQAVAAPGAGRPPQRRATSA